MIYVPHRVPRQRGDLGHAWIAPDDDLVEGVPVGAHDLVDVLGPHEVAHLSCTRSVVVVHCKGGKLEGVARGAQRTIEKFIHLCIFSWSNSEVNPIGGQKDGSTEGGACL